MNVIALDVGERHTGVAYADMRTSIPLPLATIAHRDVTDLVARVIALCTERSVTQLVIGLPLLPCGKEGTQARTVREVAANLRDAGLCTAFVDERYTTPKRASDAHADAACEILRTALDTILKDNKITSVVIESER